MPNRDNTSVGSADARNSADSTSVDGIRGKVSAALETTREKLGVAYETASQTTATAREKVGTTYVAAREKAATAGKTTVESVAANPFAAVAGGIAVGAVIGALLPRTAVENQALGAVAEKIKAGAKEALGAAKTAGIAKLTEAGISTDSAKEQFNTLLSGARDAASAAGSAAGDAVRAAKKD